MKQERVGEFMVLGQALILALSPVIINYAAKQMPPILFAALTAFTAAVFLFIYILATKQISGLKNRAAWKYIFGVALFIVIIPSSFILTGTRLTSSVNTTILLQTEILFTFLILGGLKLEKITSQKIFGAIMMVAGAVSIFYSGALKMNIGDIFIILGTLFYPIGNIFAKKALEIAKPAIILFGRNLIGCAAFILISMAFEKYGFAAAQKFATDNWQFILAQGILIYCVSKLMWYEGLKRLDITKAIPLSLSYPAYSLVYAYLFLKEIPSAYQWIGFIFSMTGILIITRKAKEPLKNYIA